MTHLFGVQIPTTPWRVAAAIIGVIVVCACQVREFVDQYGVQHELRNRIFKRLQIEGMQDAIRPLVPWTPSPAEKPLH